MANINTLRNQVFIKSAAPHPFNVSACKCTLQADEGKEFSAFLDYFWGTQGQADSRSEGAGKGEILEIIIRLDHGKMADGMITPARHYLPE